MTDPAGQRTEKTIDVKNILVTGSAGFIGFHLTKLLLADGFRVHGIDGMVDYYDTTLFGRTYDWMKARGLTEGQSQHDSLVVN